MRLIGIGWFIAICIILGVVGGKQLDNAFDTEKLFTVAGIFVGLFFGLWGGWIQLRDVLNAINRRRTGDND